MGEDYLAATEMIVANLNLTLGFYYYFFKKGSRKVVVVFSEL